MKYEQSPSGPISEQEKAFRSFISNDAALTYFLETGTMRRNAKFSKEEIYKDPAFLDFISPYIEDLYVKAVFRSFDLKDTNLISEIAANPLLLNDTYKQQAFGRIRQYLEEKKAKLISQANGIQLGHDVDMLELSDQTSIMTIAVLNYLPVDFQELRTAYANELLKLGRSLATKDFNAALNLMTDARQLKCDAQTAYDIDAFYQTLENAAPKVTAVGSAEEEEQSPWSIIGTIIGIVIFIIKLIMIFAD